jgi:hypothetical protein
MIKSLLVLASGLALVATATALAQGRGGVRGGPPSLSPRGDGLGTENIERLIESQRNRFDRDLGDQRAAREELPELRTLVRERRASAFALAQAARSGAHIPASAAARIREALSQDIDAWRAEFDVSRREWQAMRERWLVDRRSMTAAVWAEHRAAWFLARDAWIARPRELASAERFRP